MHVYIEHHEHGTTFDRQSLTHEALAGITKRLITIKSLYIVVKEQLGGKSFMIFKWHVEFIFCCKYKFSVCLLLSFTHPVLARVAADASSPDHAVSQGSKMY